MTKNTIEMTKYIDAGVHNSLKSLITLTISIYTICYEKKVVKFIKGQKYKKGKQKREKREKGEN